MALKLPEAYRTFPVPLYPGRVYLYLSRSRFNAISRALGCASRVDIRNAGVCLKTTHPKTGVPLYVVGWFDKCTRTLVHETTHAALFVLEDVGISPTDSRGEPLCYLLGALIHEMETAR